jgi:hypothetical protein
MFTCHLTIHHALLHAMAAAKARVSESTEFEGREVPHFLQRMQQQQGNDTNHVSTQVFNAELNGAVLLNG